jgi:hypothetical protein
MAALIRSRLIGWDQTCSATCSTTKIEAPVWSDLLMAHRVLTETAVSISKHKKNPMATVAAGEGMAVAVLNRNEPAFYCVPARAYEELMDPPSQPMAVSLALGWRGTGGDLEVPP